MHARPKAHFRLRIVKDDAIAVGPGKVDLLEAIDATGSIEDQQRQMRDIATQEFGDNLHNGHLLRASQGDIDAAQAAPRVL